MQRHHVKSLTVSLKLPFQSGWAQMMESFIYYTNKLGIFLNFRNYAGVCLIEKYSL